MPGIDAIEDEGMREFLRPFVHPSGLKGFIGCRQFAGDPVRFYPILKQNPAHKPLQRRAKATTRRRTKDYTKGASSAAVEQPKESSSAGGATERYVCFPGAPNSIRSCGYGAWNRQSQYRQLDGLQRKPWPDNFDGMKNICAPRNFILRLRAGEPRYPTELFIRVAQGRQETDPLFQFCQVGTTEGIEYPAFALPPNAYGDLQYADVVEAFNLANGDPKNPSFFADLLLKIFEHHGTSLDEDNMISLDGRPEGYDAQAAGEVLKFREDYERRRSGADSGDALVHEVQKIAQHDKARRGGPTKSKRKRRKTASSAIVKV